MSLMVMYGFGIYQPSLKAKWWIIDDHEIIAYLGEDQKVGWKEIPQLLLKSELGAIGKSERCRPSYWGLRFSEMALWGAKPEFWYWSRLIMLVAAMWGSWELLCQFLPRSASLLIVFYTYSRSYWADIIFRLGPSEIYSLTFLVATLLLGVLIMKKIWWGLQVRAWEWWVWMLVFILAVGSKENMIFLTPLPLVMGGWAWKKGRVTKSMIITLGLAWGFGLVVVWGIVSGAVIGGRDVYSQSTNLGSRLSLLLSGLKSLGSVKAFMIPTVISMGWLAIVTREKREKIIGGLVGFCLVGFYLFQYIFYNGILPTGIRYDFPALLVVPAMLSWLVYLIYIDGKYFINQRMLEGITTMGLLILVIVNNNGVFLRRMAEENLARTQNFTSIINQATKDLNNGKEDTVVIESRGLIDVEPAESVSRFLIANGVKDKIFLRLVGFDDMKVADSWGGEIKEYMKNASEKGKPGAFQPLAKMSPELKKYCLGLSSQTLGADCVKGVIVTSNQTNYILGGNKK